MAKKKFSLAMVALGVLSIVAFITLFVTNLGHLQSDSQTLKVGVTNELPSALFHLVEGKGFVEEDFDMEIVEFGNEEDMLSAFEKEEINLIGIAFEDAITMFEFQPDVRSIAATSSIYTQIDQESLDLAEADVFVVKEVTLNSMAEEVGAIFKAWFEAVDYAQEFPEESSGILADRADIEADISGYDFLTLRENITVFSYNSGPYSLYNRGKAIQRYVLENQDLEIEELIDDSIIQEIYE